MLKLVIVICILSVAAFLIVNPKLKDKIKETAQENFQSQNTDEPPLKLKGIGVEFSDFKFTKEKLQFDRIFMGFGFFIPASPDYPSKKNPQPTFIVPLHTPVRSLVDGVVANIPMLWSKDYSIQVTADGKMQKWIYETEHILNPTVKVGDRVKAGQVIGEVSDYDKGAPAGFGIVEIGVLKGGNPPEHVCPFAYLDDAIKEKTSTEVKLLFKSWEEYTGNSTLYNESDKIPGCLTLEAIPG